jgi:eukaryotic-like serine/threonine-protein kinase
MTNPKICPTCGTSYGPENLFCPLDSAPLRSTGDEGELIGSILAARYLVSGRLGAGGMGTVYRAQDVRLQRAAAIKVLHAGLARDPEALARFSREASNASKISNPHVVQVYDVGEVDGGAPYLAMEFVPGSSLKKLLDQEAPFTLSRAAALLSQIARGLDAAHRLGIVHRDLKPDNILMTEDEAGTEVAKVADFGISKAIRDESQRITKTGYVSGTYEFMSPEQVTGGAVDQRSDVYALGLIAFLMLTGKLPFPGTTAEHSMLMRLTEPPCTLGRMCPEAAWPEELQRVIDTALARDPGGRYGSAGQFARDFSAAIDAGRPAAVRPTRAMPWWAWIGLGGGLAAGLVAVGVWLWPGGERGRTVSGELLQPLPPLSDSSRVLSGLGPKPPVPDSAAAIDSSSAAVVPKPSPAVDTSRAAVKDTVKKPPVHRRPRPRTDDPSEGAGLAFGLGPYDTILHPEMSRDSALLTLRALDALKGRLTTRRDSVEVDIYRAQAYALAGDEERACAILQEARPKASTLQRKKIALWVDQGYCTGPNWQPS